MIRSFLLLCLLLVLFDSGLAAQSPESVVVLPDSVLPAADSATMFTPSSSWVYPRNHVSDPVVPPETLYSTQNLPTLRLSAVMYDIEAPRESRALVLLDGIDPVRRVVREGDRIGSYTIRRIEPRRLVVLVSTLGGVRTQILVPSASASPVPR